MQASATANAQAWAAAEASLTARLNDAESAAAAAAEREKRAWEKLQASNMRLAATAAAIEALKAELTDANAGQLTSVQGWACSQLLIMQSSITLLPAGVVLCVRMWLWSCLCCGWKLYLKSSGLCHSFSSYWWRQCVITACVGLCYARPLGQSTCWAWYPYLRGLPGFEYCCSDPTGSQVRAANNAIQ